MVKIYFDSFLIDLTKWVDMGSISIRKTGDKTLDSASFNIPQIEHLSGLDVSRPFPRLARVTIQDDEFILQTDTISDLGGFFSHDIELVSVAKLMADTITAGLTVTQPAGEIGLYYRSFSIAAGATIKNTNKIEVPFITLEQSSDISDIQDRIIKKTKTYQINFKGTFYTNEIWVDFNVPNYYLLDIIIEVDGVVEKQETVRVEKRVLGIGKIKKITKNMTLNYDNDGTKEVKVYVQAQVVPQEVSYNYTYEGTQLGISSNEENIADKITLDYVVEKILHNNANKQMFYLSENAKSVLETQYSYEWTLAPSYLWLQITQIADYIKAFPTAYYEDDKIIVDIVPFDDLAVEYTPVGITDKGAQATIDDYAASIEINADNIYSEENYITEITTLRSSGEITQLSTDDLIIPTSMPVGEVLGLRVRIPATITVGSITKSQGQWIEIDVNRILRQEYYNTLESMSSYTGAGRFAFSKNNCLYFKQGEKGIFGLDYIGLTTKSLIDLTDYIRGIYEVIIAQLTRDNGDSGVDFIGTFDNGKVERDNLIAAEIKYRPYTATNAMIYKSDQSGFQFSTSKFLNESGTLNSPDIIGAYTQGIADRSGGTVHSFNGVCKYDDLPDILSKWGDLVLFAISYTFIDWDTVEYQLQYIKDYVFISSYESYNPKVRLYEVPKDSVIDRVHKKNIHIYFDINEKTNEYYNTIALVQHLGLMFPDNVAKVAAFNHDGIETAIPAISQALGRVVEIRATMKDNYSAGLTKYINGDETYQRDFSYTNAFGRVHHTEVSFRKAFKTMSIAQINQLPNNAGLNAYKGDTVAFFGFDERKDARERSVYSMQFAYLSENNGIIIYDGIAKFSNYVTQSKPKEIKWVEVSKLPNRHQVTIDKETIIRDASVNLDVVYKRLTINTTGKNPVVCYDQQSEEILLGDNRKLNTRTIYIRGIEI